MGEVLLAWAAMDEWIDRHSPASAQFRRGPATQEEIKAAEQRLGLRFPSDFVESIRRHDGQPHGCTDFPYYPLLPLADVVSTRQMLVEIASSPDEPEDELGQGPGDDEWWWHEQWLPIAKIDGDVQFLDCRPGPGYGRLGSRPRDGGAHFGPGWGWPSFGAYLEAVATALTGDGDFDGMTPHLTAEDELCWAVPDEADELLTPVSR
jgi:cell wall assembly regulator SMI1